MRNNRDKAVALVCSVFSPFVICAYVLIFAQSCKYIQESWNKPTIPDVINIITNAPAPDSTCNCDISKPLYEPDRGEECPLPWGLDIRFLALSPSKQDWVFIGFNKASCLLENGKLTGRCFEKDGKNYHYKGQKQRSSSAELITDRTVEVKPCHRVYYECR